MDNKDGFEAELRWLEVETGDVATFDDTGTSTGVGVHNEKLQNEYESVFNTFNGSTSAEELSGEDENNRSISHVLIKPSRPCL
jgi:hypothetical protein